MDQVNAFPVPDMKDLLAYYDAVRENHGLLKVST
jgi:hypothetical protein